MSGHRFSPTAAGQPFYTPAYGGDGYVFQVRPQWWRLYAAAGAVLFGVGIVVGIQLESHAPHFEPSVNVCRVDEVGKRADCVAPQSVAPAAPQGVR